MMISLCEVNLGGCHEGRGAEWDRQTRKLNNACPAGAAGRVASGEWQMADGGGQMADDGRMTNTG